MIEENITTMIKELQEIKEQMEKITGRDELASKFCSELSAACGSSSTYGVMVQLENKDFKDEFYGGNVVIGRKIKTPSKIISDLITNMSIEEKRTFLIELKPILKKYIKIEQDWFDFTLAFADKINIPDL